MSQKNSLFLISLIFYGLIFAQNPGQYRDYWGQRIVNINVTQPWTDTGLNCQKGDTIFIFIRGVFSSTTNDPNAWFSPDGTGNAADSQFPAPNATSYSVIGKIRTSGTPFAVGSHENFITSTSGELYLGLNDIINFSDNGGALVANIFIRRYHGQTKVVYQDAEEPSTINLDQNYPNPFNPKTTINYNIPKSAYVDISIYNANGQLIRNLFSGRQEAGTNSITWDGRDDRGIAVATGSYFYQVKSGGLVEAREMLLIK